MNREQELEKLIIYHKALYYQGRPEISDSEYDEIEDSLKKINPNNPALNLVGSIVESTDKVQHEKRMLSLEKTYDLNELKSWCKGLDVISQLKIDGVSCSLIYNDSKLVMAKTRGDGAFGEDITAKVRWIQSVPHALDNFVEVRGELYCSEEDFLKLSCEMGAIGENKPTSQRNIVAGLLLRKENIELCRYLKFFAFDVIGLNLNTEIEKIKFLKDAGFEVPKYIFHKKAEELEDAVELAKNSIEDDQFQVDGLVVTFNDIAIQNELGEASHHPKYKIAFKFKGESKTSKIKEIQWSISMNGIYTPVAVIEPIELSGAIIQNVTLHNLGHVREWNLKKGDEIEVIRSGEVIPKIIGVKEQVSGTIKIPEICEYCQSELNIDEIRLVCPNIQCSGRIRNSILNYISKVEIYDISEKRLDEMLKFKIVNSIPDLYSLNMEKLLLLPKTKDKLASKILSSIEKSKTIQLPTFLSALGIQGLGKNKCQKIIDAGYDSLQKVMNLNKEELSRIDLFAEKTADDFIIGMSQKKELILKLIDAGITILVPKKISSKFIEKRFVITGALSRPRKEIENYIRENGGIVSSSVSKETTFLVTNEKESNSSKYKNAIKYKTPIITEEELFNME